MDKERIFFSFNHPFLTPIRYCQKIIKDTSMLNTLRSFCGEVPMNIRRVLLMFPMIVVVLFVMVSSTQAQTPDLDYQRYDVEITVNEDGTFSVRETQHVYFRDSFRTGFAEIPLDFVAEIENIRVSGGDTFETVSPYSSGNGPFTYGVDWESDAVYVEWEFFPTEWGDEKIFVVEYDVVGGLWVYSDMHTLEWRAVAEDRSGVDVEASTVTVNLPFLLGQNELDSIAFGPEYETTFSELDGGTQVVFTANGRIPNGTPFQIIVDFPSGLVVAELQPWQIVEDTANLDYTLDRIGVEMVVQEDGRLLITEQQQVTVNEGVMYSGFRKLNWLFTDGISIEQINEGDQPLRFTEDRLAACLNCYTVEEVNRYGSWVEFLDWRDEVSIREEAAGETVAEWSFPELVRGESTTFTLVYLVDGAIRINEDGTQEISWTVIPGYDALVTETQVRLLLPGGLGLEDVAISGGDVSRDGNGIVVVPKTAVSPNTAWQIDLTLPESATTASKPAWQVELEAAFAEADAYRVRQARIDLGWLVGKIGAGVTAVLAAIVSWYLWGSRKLREKMGSYRTTPPSDLPPGIVAYLVDKTPTAKGILASLLHLATLGLIRVSMDDELTVERVVDHKIGMGSIITSASGESVTVPLHAARLFNKLQPLLSLGESVSLAKLAPSLPTAIPDLYAAMGEEMVSHYYGSGNSEWRTNLKKVIPFIWFVGTAVFMFAFVSGGISPDRNPAVLFLVMGGGFALMVFLTRQLERPKAALSELGRQEAKKWLGFKAYLQEISRFGTMVEAQDIMERYFAYAVALGVDETLLAQVQAMGVQVPGWIGNGRYPNGTPWQNKPHLPHTSRRADRWRRRWQQGSWLPRPPRPQTPVISEEGGISLQGLSDQLTDSLESASSRMTTMLNTAVGDAKPVDVVIRGGGHFSKLEWKPGTSMDTIMKDIMSKSQSIRPPRPSAGSGSGGYTGGGRSSGGFRRSGSSRSSSRRSSSRSSSRRSSSRRSGGGGRRGFK